ncbi:MAG TPA: MFS transporter [Mycobacteriales bacterium]
MRRLARIPAARTYLTGQSLSILGDTALWLALAIWVRELTGSSAAAGLSFVFLVGPFLLGPLWGMVADRVRRRPLLIALNAGGGLLTLALLAVRGPGQVWLIYLVMSGYGVLSALLTAAQAGLLHSLVPEDLLGDATGFLSVVREGLRLVAPLLGAGLFAVAGGHTVAVLDSATFAVAAVTVVRTRVQEPPPAPRPARLRAELSAGFAHIRGDRVLSRLVLAFAAAATVIGFGESTGIAAITDGLHVSATWIGVTQAVMGAGALVGGATLAPALRRFGEPPVAAVGLLLFAVGCACYLLPSLPLVVGTRVVAGFGLPWAIGACNTALLRRTPSSLQGRVSATSEMTFALPQTISIAVGAGLMTLVGFRWLLVAETVVIAVAGGWLLARKDSRAAVTPVAGRDTSLAAS